MSGLSGFICKHTEQQERFLSIPLFALSSRWWLFRSRWWYVSSNRSNEISFSYFSRFQKEKKRKPRYLSSFGWLVPRCYSRRFFCVPRNSRCRAKAILEHISVPSIQWSNGSFEAFVLLLASRSRILLPARIAQLLAMPIFSQRSSRWKKDRGAPPLGRLVIRRSVSTIYRGLCTYSRAPVGGAAAALRAAYGQLHRDQGRPAHNDTLRRTWKL